MAVAWVNLYSCGIYHYFYSSLHTSSAGVATSAEPVVRGYLKMLVLLSLHAEVSAEFLQINNCEAVL